MRFYVPFVAATVVLGRLALAQSGPAAQTPAAQTPALPLGAEAPNDWVVDDKTGCKAWDDAPDPDETISWSGACTDGMTDGKGTLQFFVGGKPGTRYEGEMRNGRANGHGVNLAPDGARYEGEWRDNAPDGFGVYTKGGERLEGTWHKGCLKQGATERAVAVSRASCGFK
jgi:hypothetical protein